MDRMIPVWLERWLAQPGHSHLVGSGSPYVTRLPRFARNDRPERLSRNLIPLLFAVVDLPRRVNYGLGSSGRGSP